MKHFLGQLITRLKVTLHNPVCLACHKPHAQHPGERLCDGCLKKLGLRDTFPLARTAQGSTYTATLFNPAVKRLVYGHKFRQRPHAQTTLGELLITYWQRVLESIHAPVLPQPGAIIVTAIPPHAGQASHLSAMAEAFAQHFGYGYEPNLLRWTRTVTPQHSLTSKKSRLANLQGSLSVDYPTHMQTLLKTRQVLILDDIHTTGATMQEALRALKDCPAYDGAATGLALTHLFLAFQNRRAMSGTAQSERQAALSS